MVEDGARTKGHEGGHSPLCLPAICPARPPARCPSVRGIGPLRLQRQVSRLARRLGDRLRRRDMRDVGRGAGSRRFGTWRAPAVPCARVLYEPAALSYGPRPTEHHLSRRARQGHVLARTFRDRARLSDFYEKSVVDLATVEHGGERYDRPRTAPGDAPQRAAHWNPNQVRSEFVRAHRTLPTSRAALGR
jgi:hypothetical protein